ncbi:hypothetical protein BKA70DRAFT_1431723 [Coprinopsis sp. MPI-PUGE-AT-0042]|nr:hypothetical protein BKA70DRAFT_1431723 [Coprinopsis sp. MPI-PUGE-AT-0042]
MASTGQKKKSPLWKLYYTDGNKYRNDKSHFNAWCAGCLDSKIRGAKFEFAAAVAKGLEEADPTKDDAYWFEYCKRLVDPKCGKLHMLEGHATSCPLTDPVALKEVLQEIQAKKQIASSFQVQKENFPSYRYVPVIPPLPPPSIFDHWPCGHRAHRH